MLSEVGCAQREWVTDLLTGIIYALSCCELNDALNMPNSIPQICVALRSTSGRKNLVVVPKTDMTRKGLPTRFENANTLRICAVSKRKLTSLAV